MDHPTILLCSEAGMGSLGIRPLACYLGCQPYSTPLPQPHSPESLIDGSVPAKEGTGGEDDKPQDRKAEVHSLGAVD